MASSGSHDADRDLETRSRETRGCPTLLRGAGSVEHRAPVCKPATLPDNNDLAYRSCTLPWSRSWKPEAPCEFPFPPESLLGIGRD